MTAIEDRAVFAETRERFWEFYTRYEKYIPAAFFLGGFLWDNLTLTRIDQWLDMLILFGYLAVSGFGIALIHLVHSTRRAPHLVTRFSGWYPNVVQFAFGGLFSGLVVFYLRSGELAASWPFLLLLVGLFVANEFIRNRYVNLTIQLSVFYVVLFSFVIFYVPIVVKRMGADVFVLSGVMSLVLMALFVYGLSYLVPRRIRFTRRALSMSIGGLFLLFNIFYFTNVIPPLPLSMKELDIYHAVERLPEGGYRVRFEEPAWYAFWKESDSSTFRWQPGQPVYAYAAVFAPTDLDTRVFHHWQYYDEARGVWESRGRISYDIAGGRDGGYRGFTFKQSVEQGQWRVDVETQRGQIIGRERFEIVRVDKLPDLVESVR